MFYGGVPGGATISLGFLGPVTGNKENCIKGAHRFPLPNHGEVGMSEHGKDVGDTDRGGSEVNITNVVISHLHWA